MFPSLSAIGTSVLLLQSQFASGILVGKTKIPPLLAHSFGESLPIHDAILPRFDAAPEDTIFDFNSTYVNTSTFQQLIDHDDPSLGTFTMTYYWSQRWWKGPGYPVVLFTPGEANAYYYSNFLTNETMLGHLSQEMGAAAIILEHRYYNNSSPFAKLTTENLQYLTLKNVLADINYFANNVDLPFAPDHSNNADVSPWVFSACSYGGSLASWLATISPGTFWAYHASSAPIQEIYNFWELYLPIQRGMPKNCSTDVEIVTDYIDSVLMSGNETAIVELKTMFGLEGIEHNDDFGFALAQVPTLWHSPSFFEWCDAVEGVDVGGEIPGPEGVGLEKALAGHARYVNTTFFPGYCAGNYPRYIKDQRSVECFDSYNASSPFYTNTNVLNGVNRQYNWMLCNEPFANWQGGAPIGVPTIASRLVTPEYYQRQCGLYFPTEGNYTYGSNRGRTVDDVNAYTGGWFPENTSRLLWTDGEFDLFIEETVSASTRPGGPKESTKEAPIFIIPGGGHCEDYFLENGDGNPGLKGVIDSTTEQIKAWVAEYYA